MATETAFRADDKLIHPLQKLQGIIRRFVMFDVLLFIGLFATLWFWLGLAIDFGLFKATRADIAQQYTPLIRIVVFAILAITLVGLVIYRVRGLLTKELSYPSLALVLEKRYPTVLGDRLITAIEMADEAKAEREGYSIPLVRHTVEEARERIDQVNVRSVFAWNRLYGKLAFIVAVSAVGVLTAFGLHYFGTKQFQPDRAAKAFADVSGIWTERNILMMSTPWPRRAHIEIVDFDDEGHKNELRVGKGAPIPPKVSALASKWVVVAPDTYDGWRPMLVKDLQTFGLQTPSAFASVKVGDDGKQASESVSFSGDEPIDVLETKYGSTPEFAPLFESLNAASDKLENTRKLRRLVVPGDLALRYDVISTRSRSNLTMSLDSTGKFSTDIPGLSDSIRFSISAEDFTTARRTITVVAPPTLVELYRDERQPGYLHHAAPILTEDEKKPESELAKRIPLAVSNPQFALRDLRQARTKQNIGITSDRSLFSVPLGTELTIAGTADKDLKKIELRPVTPNAKPEFLTFPAGSARQFEVKFDRANAIRSLDKPTEFQLVLTDTDNVSSIRTIAIQCLDDGPPSVDVIVDPIVRRLGGYLLVTPKAMIPFLPDSKISDDNGLSTVRLEFKKEEDEATSLVVARAMAAAALTLGAQAPLNTMATPGTIAAHHTLFNGTFASTIPQKDAGGNEKLPGLAMPRFLDTYGLIPRKNLSQIAAEAKADPKVDPNAISPMLRSIKLTDFDADAFDLMKYMPTLEEKDTAKIQPRYKLEVFVVAQDTNVEQTGKDGQPLPPKTTKNLDPIRIQVISEQDLLQEIGKDEEMQRVRMEDIVKKATDARLKLSTELARLNGVSKSNLTPPEIEEVKNAQVRFTDMLLDVAKARDLLTTLRSEFDKLYKEYTINRINENNMRRYRDPEKKAPAYLDLLDAIFDKSMPAAEQALTAVNGTLATVARPNDESMVAARDKYGVFYRDIEELSQLIGQGEDIRKAQAALASIIRNEQFNQRSIFEILDEVRTRNLIPDVIVPKLTTVAVGKSAKVKVTVVWKQFAGNEAYVAMDVPAASEIKAPKEFKVKLGANDLDQTTYELEITAGTKPGLHTLRLLPGPFIAKRPIKPVDLNIEVTK